MNTQKAVLALAVILMVISGCSQYRTHRSKQKRRANSVSEWGCVKIPGTEGISEYSSPDSRICWRNSKAITHIKIANLEILRLRTRAKWCLRGHQDILFLHGNLVDDGPFFVKRLLDKINVETPCTDQHGRRYKTQVFLSSNSGDMQSGYTLGRLFRKYDVFTNITTNQTCASACATAFLGGTSRSMHSSTAKLLFHTPYPNYLLLRLPVLV